ncbi:hypothetical protein [Paenibacillus pabuli]|uniref:hypothetical protein n=1 Tax=Paenibacillus pabuli TaxID=1472 RepID=UPI003CED82D7
MFFSLSHSVWSAWIEIEKWIGKEERRMESHSVWSAWIEILLTLIPKKLLYCRTPYGVRGLKLLQSSSR